MIRHQPTGVPMPVAGVSRAGFRALLSNAGARVGLNGENMRPSLAQSSDLEKEENSQSGK